MNKHSLQRFFLPFLILLSVFVVYLPCLKANFVNWDDDIHVLNNLSIRSLQWAHWVEIWTSTVNDTYIPLTSSSWALEHHFYGFNPFVFHLDNVLLHLGVTALVLVFSLRMGLSMGAASLAALIFGVHPLHVESVAWVTERKDVLYGILYMAALLTYLHYLDFGRKEYFWLTVWLGALSICAKPMAVSLPLVLLVLDSFRGRRWESRMIFEKIFCGAVLVPIAFITYLANSTLVEPASGHGPLIWIWCFMFYLYKFIFPWPMILFYGFPQSGNMFYLNVLGFAGLLMALWILRRNRLFVFAIAFYFANIFFLLRFHSFWGLVFDRAMYLPSIGLCMFFAVTTERLFMDIKGWKVCFYSSSLCLLLVAMAVMSHRQCEVWQSSMTLWRHQLQYDSKQVRWLAYCKLADAYATVDSPEAPDAQSFNEAAMLYNKAIQLKVNFPNAYLGMGHLWEGAGHWDLAQKYFEEALAIAPNNFDALYSLGKIYRHNKLRILQ